MTQHRRALVVGINLYNSFEGLERAAADAHDIAEQLEKHADGTPNYECRLLVDDDDPASKVERRTLRQAMVELFAPDFTGDALFYFSGHGALTATGGYLATFDSEENDWGIPMQELMDLAYNSKAQNILIIVDACFAGGLANVPSLNRAGTNPLATLREDMTVIASSRDTQTSEEGAENGAFTAAVLDALAGGAADHMGWVTAPAIYAYVERRFGAWGQRPIYKSHCTRVAVVRECAPLIERMKLRELIRHFPTVDYKYQLDPEHEPEDEHGNRHEPVNQEKVNLAGLFKEYRDAGLLKPSEPNEQLYWTARRSHAVQLTIRGREYWWLAREGKL